MSDQTREQGEQEKHMTELKHGNCPMCSHPYPAPLRGVESVTCGSCGYVNCLRGRDLRDIIAIGLAVVVLWGILAEKPTEKPEDYDGFTGNPDDDRAFASNEVYWRHGLLAEEALSAITSALLGESK